MKSSTSFGFSSSLLFFFIVAASINVVYSEDAASVVVNSETTRSCSYLFTVRTGNVADAGTDSRISVTLGNIAGLRLEIPDLKERGTMPAGHDYFEKGNKDNFRVDDSECIFGTVALCNITVTSDGSGKKPGWFLGEVDIVTRELKNIGTDSYHSINKINFDFNKWLAKDEPPYKLTAPVNKCPSI